MPLPQGVRLHVAIVPSTLHCSVGVVFSGEVECSYRRVVHICPVVPKQKLSHHPAKVVVSHAKVVGVVEISLTDFDAVGTDPGPFFVDVKNLQSDCSDVTLVISHQVRSFLEVSPCHRPVGDIGWPGQPGRLQGLDCDVAFDQEVGVIKA